MKETITGWLQFFLMVFLILLGFGIV